MNENLRLLKNRFPALYELLPQKESPALSFALSKTNVPVLMEKRDGREIPLNSKYNPMSEAEKNSATFDTEKEGAVFFSPLLAYECEIFARNFPKKSIYIIEPDPLYFYTSLFSSAWSTILKHEKLFLIDMSSFWN